jgi:hypothetical protein
MPRLKFLLFALVAIALAVVHIPAVSTPLSARAVDQAQALAQGAPAAVAVRIAQHRLDLLHASVVAAATTPVVAAARGGKTEVVLPQRTVELRAALQKAIPAELKNQLVVGFLNDEKTLYVRGDGQPVTDGTGLDVTALTAAQPDGVVVDAFETPHIFYVIPLSRMLETGEAKPIGSFFLGAPLLLQQDVDEARSVAGVTALSVLDRNAVKWHSGEAHAAKIEIKPGFKGVVERAPAKSIIGLDLPLFAGQGGAVSMVGARQVIPSSRFEVASVVTVKPFMSELAEYQQLALMGLAGLFLLGLLGTIFAGAAEEPAPAMSVEQRVLSYPPPLPRSEMQLQSNDEDDSDNERTMAIPNGDLSSLQSEAPEASPDDFEFPNSNNARPPPTPMLSDDDLSSPPPPMSEPEFGGQYQGGAYATDDSPTAAYPVHQPELQNLAPLAYAEPEQAEPEDDDDFNPEQTRIAEIPEALIRQSARNTSDDLPAVSRPPPVNQEDQHYQDVYRDFISTRERCGEPADGLTYDKFAAKLRKNRDQLVQKYNCKTVRFQVYVKDGKAALKATPVKE